jgi:hypothetical protein
MDDSPRWPTGCYKPNSCSRNHSCMYGCKAHLTRNISAEIDRAIAELNAVKIEPTDAHPSPQPDAIVEALATALKPFSEASEDLDQDHRDTSPIWECPVAMVIYAGDLRAAHKALAAYEASRSPPATDDSALDGVRKILSEMATMRFGCSGKSKNEVNDWFNDKARTAIAALIDRAAASGEVS